MDSLVDLTIRVSMKQDEKNREAMDAEQQRASNGQFGSGGGSSGSAEKSPEASSKAKEAYHKAKSAHEKATGEYKETLKTLLAASPGDKPAALAAHKESTANMHKLATETDKAHAAALRSL